MPPIELIITAGAVVGALAVLWRPARKFVHFVKATAQFIEDWNGTPERVDRAGRVIEKAQPGFPAVLEEVRSQVQNSHRTNLRDDLDRLHADVVDLKSDLREHILIAKEMDERRDEAEARLSDDIGALRSRYAPEA